MNIHFFLYICLCKCQKEKHMSHFSYIIPQLSSSLRPIFFFFVKLSLLLEKLINYFVTIKVYSENVGYRIEIFWEEEEKKKKKKKKQKVKINSLD